jgi:peptide/nickel transport system substrate-binding protein
VVIKSVNEPSTMIQLLKTGDADLIHVGVYPRNILAQLQAIKTLKVQPAVASLSVQGVFFNFGVRGGNPAGVLGSGKLDGKGIPANFFSDLNVRKAFTASFDSAGYIRQQLLGGGLQAGGALIKGISGYDPALRYRYDAAAATAAFKKAWSGQVWKNGFTINLAWDSGNANHQQAALLLKRTVEGLNTKFHINVQELQNSAIVAARSQGQLPIWLGSWGADYADAYNFAQPLLESNGFYPQQNGYHNPKVDALISQAVASTVPATSTTFYRQAQTLAFNDVAFLPIYQPQHFTAEQPWIKGHAVNPLSGFSAYFYPISK